MLIINKTTKYLTCYLFTLLQYYKTQYTMRIKCFLSQ